MEQIFIVMVYLALSLQAILKALVCVSASVAFKCSCKSYVTDFEPAYYVLYFIVLVTENLTVFG
jgi:hypothetical protein